MNEVPELKTIALRGAALNLFQAGINNYQLKYASSLMKDYVRNVGLPKDIKDAMLDMLTKAFGETTRWWEKHSELMVDDKRKVTRSEHLRLCFEFLSWRTTSVTIDDLASARCVMQANEDWPQLQFQFACGYALEPELRKFDKIRLRAFRKKLVDHPLYDFWFLYLTNEECVFDPIGISPKQVVSLVFQWALYNGYYELTKFLWNRTTDAQREYMAMLQWRRICLHAKHSIVFHFICMEMCAMNKVNISRISSQIFLQTLQKVLTETVPTIRDMHMNRLTFMFINCCDWMRENLFQTQNYRVLYLVMQQKDIRLFRFFQNNVTSQMLSSAIERLGTDFPAQQIAAAKAVAKMPQRQWSIA